MSASKSPPMCPICKEEDSFAGTTLRNQPLVLVPCGHSICSGCKPRNDAAGRRCPECRAGIDTAVVSYEIKRITAGAQSAPPPALRGRGAGGSGPAAVAPAVAGAGAGAVPAPAAAAVSLAGRASAPWAATPDLDVSVDPSTLRMGAAAACLWRSSDCIFGAACRRGAACQFRHHPSAASTYCQPWVACSVADASLCRNIRAAAAEGGPVLLVGGAGAVRALPFWTRSGTAGILLTERCRVGPSCMHAHPHRRRVSLTDCPTYLRAAHSRGGVDAARGSTDAAGRVSAAVGAGSASASADGAAPSDCGIPGCRMRHCSGLFQELARGNCKRLNACPAWAAGFCRSADACPLLHAMDARNPFDGDSPYAFASTR
jgi:hypothetical protein